MVTPRRRSTDSAILSLFTVENVVKFTGLVIMCYVLLNRMEVKLEGIDNRLGRIERVIDAQIKLGK